MTNQKNGRRSSNRSNTNQSRLQNRGQHTRSHQSRGRKMGFPWKTVIGTTALAAVGGVTWFLMKPKDTDDFARDRLRDEESPNYNDYGGTSNKNFASKYAEDDDYYETYSGAY